MTRATRYAQFVIRQNLLQRRTRARAGASLCLNLSPAIISASLGGCPKKPISVISNEAERREKSVKPPIISFNSKGSKPSGSSSPSLPRNPERDEQRRDGATKLPLTLATGCRKQARLEKALLNQQYPADTVLIKAKFLIC
jgi:hypothetical protein